MINGASTPSLNKRNSTHFSQSIYLIGFSLIMSYTTLLSTSSNNDMLFTFSNNSIILTCMIGLSQIITCLIIAFTTQQLGRKNILLLITSCLSAFSAFTIGLMLIEIIPGLQNLYLVARIVARVSSIIIWLAWVELYARMDMSHVIIYYLFVHVCASLLTFIVEFLPIILQFLIIVIIPIISCIALMKCESFIDNLSFAQGETATKKWSFPWRPLLLMAFFTFVNLFVRDALPIENRGYATIGVTFVTLLVLVIYIRNGIAKFNIWSLCRIAFPLTLGGLFCILQNNVTWNIVASLFTNAGYALFSVFFIAILCNLSYRYGVSALFLFGCSWAGEAGGRLLGSVFANLSMSWASETVIIFVSIITFIFSIFISWLIGNSDSETVWGVKPRGNIIVPLISFHDALVNTCAKLAREYGLTRREEEVLILLAQGKTTAYIEQELFITNATVKSHIRLVYKKLGVHNRQQLMDYVSGEIEYWCS